MATIPDYKGIRAVVPDTYDPTRRAGSGGQRYFTDVEYVPVPTLSGDRWMHDTKNYLAANPDLVDYYNTNKAALLEGGDDRFETVEGYGKWHYDTLGKWENRNLAPTHDATGNVIPTPEGTAQATADAAALQYKAQNLANPAREGLSSLQRVTDSALATDIGEIQAYDATDRQKIDQVIGYMNEQAVSPYRLSTVTSTPLSDIQTAMNPYYRTEAEQKAQALASPQAGIKAALATAATESQTRPYQNFLRHIPVDGTYSAEEIGSVTDLLNSGTITIDQIATYFNVPVEEVRQFYREQGNRQGFQAGGLTSVGPQGMYLGGSTDGMADNIPASINSNQPARLSDGEFVGPADVVSHLGNGNSDAGAHQLYGMMDRVRQARTGTAEQGRQINPGNFLT